MVVKFQSMQIHAKNNDKQNMKKGGKIQLHAKCMSLSEQARKLVEKTLK